MSTDNAIPIWVPDEDPDELGRIRARVRKNRRRVGQRLRNEFRHRILRLLLNYWAFVVILLVVALLVFEVSRIAPKSTSQGKPGTEERSRSSGSSELKSEKETNGNLNRLDHTTRMVSGVRERCLKLLPPEKLELLDIPVHEPSTVPAVESTVPAVELYYISENDPPSLAEKKFLSGQKSQDSRFNLFTGNQTFNQREKSFNVKDTAMVHCGFFSENGGFKVSEEDKNYLRTCQVVLSTCAFGGGDDLYQPIGMSNASLHKVCYVAFWDEITLSAQESMGHKIDEAGFIGKWRIIVVRDLPFRDQRLNGKIPKMLGHRLFPHAKYSIWVDSKSQFRRDPLGVLEALLWRTNSVLAISEHGARSSVYDEAKAVVKKHKATPKEVEIQLTQYRNDGLPEDKRFNGKKALAEASVIVREHSPTTNLFMCLWFNEVVRFTSRDQLSFPYVQWRSKLLKNINMFPVCTRKDLVNSMGHIGKAKPLIA